MPKRVLAVDDELNTLKLIRKALESHGLEVATAANGAECLLAIQERLPDLVILDVMMPVLDGLQTMRALRENPATRHLPVIMLTARREDQDITRGWMSGVDLYLTKPFEIKDLLTAVDRVLQVSGEAGAGEEAAP
jgi:DNA-binding response OmpR family regulator